MNSKEEITGPINLGNPVEYTVLELAELIRNKTQSHSPIVFRDLPKDDPRQRRPDISKAAVELGWSPITPLEQGLTKTIEYFKKVI